MDTIKSTFEEIQLDIKLHFWGPSSDAPNVFFFSSVLHCIMHLVFIYSAIKVSMAAHRTIQSKVVKFGTLVEDHVKQPWRQFDVDWPKGGATANS